MSERWRSKAHYIDVVRYDDDGAPYSGPEPPPLPVALAEFVAEAENGEELRWVDVTTRAAQREWLLMCC